MYARLAFYQCSSYEAALKFRAGNCAGHFSSRPRTEAKHDYDEAEESPNVIAEDGLPPAGSHKVVPWDGLRSDS